MTANSRTANCLAILSACWFGGNAWAAESARILGESRRTAQQFVEAAQLLDQGRVAAALDRYSTVLNEHAQDLVPRDAARRHFLSARWAAHRQIAADPRLLEAFRDRVSEQAKKSLAEGIATRDSRRLEVLVESMFCAREAEMALHYLGDFACERGEFTAAQQYWARLIPGPSSVRLAFPDPVGDPALPAAKILLSRWLAGDSAGVASDIAELEKKYRHSSVRLGGRTGPVGQVLREITAAGNARVTEITANSPGDTIAPHPSRNGAIPGQMPFPDPPLRTLQFPRGGLGAHSDSKGVQQPILTANDLAMFPVMTRRHVLAADERHVYAFELESGRLAAHFDLKSSVESLPRNIEARSARFLLTVAGSDVYARLGQSAVRSERIESDSYIVSLRFEPNDADPLRLRWILPATQTGHVDHAQFEGCPIIQGGLLYVAATRFDGNRATTDVACYDPSGSAPRLVWRQDVLETGPTAAARSSHLLLCAAEGLVICGPYQGAIVALDAATGRRAWAYRYSSAPRAPHQLSRAGPLEPSVAADGRLFAAPEDFQGVFALDLATGAPLWECDSLPVTHIIGVAAGKVVCQIGGTVSGLRAIEAVTGQVLSDWGYAVFGSDAAAPMGRGLVFEDCVCWTTRADGLKILRWDGVPEPTPAAFRAAPCANMAFGDGAYLFATPHRWGRLESTLIATDPQRREAP